MKAHRLCVSLNSSLESNKEEERSPAGDAITWLTDRNAGFGVGLGFEVWGFGRADLMENAALCQGLTPSVSYLTIRLGLGGA